MHCMFFSLSHAEQRAMCCMHCMRACNEPFWQHTCWHSMTAMQCHPCACLQLGHHRNREDRRPRHPRAQADRLWRRVPRRQGRYCPGAHGSLHARLSAGGVPLRRAVGAAHFLQQRLALLWRHRARHAGALHTGPAEVPGGHRQPAAAQLVCAALATLHVTVSCCMPFHVSMACHAKVTL